MREHLSSRTNPATHRTPAESTLAVFDGDDTLWRTQELYDAAKARFALLVALRGYKLRDPIALLDQIDAEAAETMGFSPSRFVASMVKTYRLLSEAEHRRPDNDTELEIERLSTPLRGEYQLYPDAISVLTELQKNFLLVLATKGERDLQNQKIERLAIAGFFDRIDILERKGQQEFADILSAYQMPPSRAWSIGNSVRSDINPAVELGMHAILIRRPSWRYEQANLSSDGVTIVDSLTGVRDALVALPDRPAHLDTRRPA